MRSHLLCGRNRGLIASGSAATAVKLNKRRPTVALPCRFMSAEALELCIQLGVAPTRASTATRRAMRSCPLKCSCIVLFTSSAAGYRAQFRWKKSEQRICVCVCVCGLFKSETWHEWTNSLVLAQQRSQDANINGVLFWKFAILRLLLPP